MSGTASIAAFVGTKRPSREAATRKRPSAERAALAGPAVLAVLALEGAGLAPHKLQLAAGLFHPMRKVSTAKGPSADAH